MSESNKCCEKCSTLDGYKVGENCYQKLCPCHSTTPVTEVEKLVREIEVEVLGSINAFTRSYKDADDWSQNYLEDTMAARKRMQAIPDKVKDLISSRDTSWKERVRKEVEGMKGRYKDCENGEMWDEALDTLLDNLK